MDEKEMEIIAKQIIKTLNDAGLSGNEFSCDHDHIMIGDNDNFYGLNIHKLKKTPEDDPKKTPEYSFTIHASYIPYKRFNRHKFS